MELEFGKLSAPLIVTFIAFAALGTSLYLQTSVAAELVAVVFGIASAVLLFRSAFQLNSMHKPKRAPRGKHAK